MSDNDDLRYENLDDNPDDFELEPLDLDALDDEIEPVEQDEPAAALLDTIRELDDDLESETSGDALEPTADVESEADDAEEPAAVAIELDRSEPEAELEQPVFVTAELDDKAEEMLDTIQTLDDEIEPLTAELDDKAEEMLDTIQTLDDEIEPAAAVAAAPEPAAVAEILEPVTESPEEAEPAEPVIPDTRYRVLILLPADIGQQVTSLRKLGEVKHTPPPGIELGLTFRTGDLPSVETALTDWARAHLPLQIEITGIQAEVIGAQQYIAALFVQPQKELKKAQDDLIKVLSPLTIPASDDPPALPVRLIIGERIPPKPFPRVIAQMQQSFDPYIWHAEAATLVKIEPDARKWDSVRTFD